MSGSNDKQEGNANSNISEPGLTALLKRLNALWRLEKWNQKADCDILDDPRSILTALAIPLDKAYEIWGYGQPNKEIMQAVVGSEALTYDEMVQQRLVRKGSPWTSAQLDALHLEDQKRFNLEGVRARIAKDLGVSIQRITQKLDVNLQPKRQMRTKVHIIK